MWSAWYLFLSSQLFPFQMLREFCFPYSKILKFYYKKEYLSILKIIAVGSFQCCLSNIFSQSILSKGLSWSLEFQCSHMTYFGRWDVSQQVMHHILVEVLRISVRFTVFPFPVLSIIKVQIWRLQKPTSTIDL